MLEYLVGKNSVGLEISNWKESAILKSVFLWVEWYGKFGFQKLFLMLKFSVMMRMLLILTSVFLRYFESQLRQVWIYINQITWTLIEKGDTR